MQIRLPPGSFVDVSFGRKAELIKENNNFSASGKSFLPFLLYLCTMARIDQETVQRILDAADIVDVVSDFVKLRRSGANYKGLCPFHNERTPSFSVSKSRNYCKCFSCGKGGSPVNFIMEIEQLSFQEALRYLARKYNIEIVEKDLTPEERQAASDRESMLAVNDFALSHFESNLRDTDEGRTTALAYLRHRGLSDEMIRRFHLGYSMEQGNQLVKKAASEGYKDKYLVSTGLAIESKGTLYDRFKGRVMFPVFSISGRIIAFGGRTMKSDKTIAKYVNSPESLIYKKSNELYGLYQAKSAIGKKDKCIMVEGYMDVISMHQSGIENVVASSGTSLTEGQIRAVHRFTENVTLIYDADPAGIKASLRGIKMLLAEKINVRCLLLPPGDDPDSFAQSHSSEQVEDYIRNNEKDIVTFMAEILLKDISPNDPIGRSNAVREIIQTMAFVDEPVKSQAYITLCSQLLGMPEEVIARQLKIEIAKRVEEMEKERRRREGHQQIEEEEADGQAASEQPEQASTPSQEAQPLQLFEVDKIRPFEEMIIRYLVRYGTLQLYDMNNQGSKIIRRATVFDIVEAELKCDNYRFKTPEFMKVFEEVRRIRTELWPGEHQRREESLLAESEVEMQKQMDRIREEAVSVADAENKMHKAQERIEMWKTDKINEFDIQFVQTRLLNSPDDDVRPVANTLLADKYTLSRIYSRDSGRDNESENIQTLIDRSLMELRNALLTQEVKALTLRLASAEDAETATYLISEIHMRKEVQKELMKMLGERIILPK